VRAESRADGGPAFDDFTMHAAPSQGKWSQITIDLADPGNGAVEIGMTVDGATAIDAHTPTKCTSLVGPPQLAFGLEFGIGAIHFDDVLFDAR
jgi:hypothetical protein